VIKYFGLLACISLPLSLFALNGAAEIGVGVKAKGMGGAGIALPQDVFASAYNPAGLFCVGNRIDLGVGYTALEGETQFVNISSGTINRAPIKKIGLWFPELGIAMRCGCNSFGLCAYVKGGMATHYDRRLYFNPRVGLQSRFDTYTIFITPSWSYQVAPTLSLGVAINGIVQSLRNNVDWGNQSVAPNVGTQFTGFGRLGISGGVNVRVGALLMPRPCLKIGLTYQSWPLMNKIKEYAGQWPQLGYWDWPQEIGIGASYCFRRCLLFAVDWNYTFWRDSSVYGNRTFRPEGEAGSALGAGLNCVNQTVWKVGVAWTPRECFTLRAGYNFGNSPITPQATQINPLTLACVENHVTAGATYRTCLGEVSFYYYHGFQKSVVGQGPGFAGGGTQFNLSARQNGFGLSYGRCW